MSKFGKVILIFGSVVAAVTLIGFGIKKIADSMDLLNFGDYLSW